MLKIRICLLLVLVLYAHSVIAQKNWNELIAKELPSTLAMHRTFVSLPNVADNEDDMLSNVKFIQPEFEKRGFTVQLLESTSLPVFFAHKVVNKNAKTILFYLHLDGQAVNSSKWDQDDPFVPVLKTINSEGEWEILGWDQIQGNIDPEWRVFGRAAADDKGPIMMMLTALRLLEQENVALKYNVKVILDLQEEAGSHGFLSTLEKYKDVYAADYMVIMDGPAHNSNKPTLTFGCRGIARCAITVYGAELPQHSGHYGNYVPNPIFSMAHLLASMKNDKGHVIIDDYYNDIELSDEVQKLLKQVPDEESAIQKNLGIAKPDDVGNGYQESLQYPSLNVRHIETSWKGPGLKTVIPEIVTAHIDVRLVTETDGEKQLHKIKRHIEDEGYLLLDRDPTKSERLSHTKIAKFEQNNGVNAFRTEIDHPFGKQMIEVIENAFNEKPVIIRTMGGTVPIIPAINALDIPAIIVPMVNMDNNQHNPNENLRIGNLSQGIKMCIHILSMDLS